MTKVAFWITLAACNFEALPKANVMDPCSLIKDPVPLRPYLAKSSRKVAFCSMGVFG